VGVCGVCVGGGGQMSGVTILYIRIVPGACSSMDEIAARE